ncbi:RAD51-associated protein 1 isoform X1 [Phycodurus eques]|uniref:RAD51-associated protein 1 isoform X1 n=1 Tax=Phycodurus eques TaxID=693459 RepID=UPI002ACDB3DD|nr:RAD51-associated protein 1 isoform X1 [Phycodurus eques]
MDRPARKINSVNYCESRDIDNDDEDFACVKPPPGKKPKQQEHRNTSSQEATQASHKSRKDLEAAITLSLLTNSNTGGTKQAPPASRGDENTDPASLHRSNCSVDPSLFGLDEISSSGQTNTKEEQRRRPRDADYEPQLSAVGFSESESEEASGEDEEFTGNKSCKKEESDQRKARKRPVCKQERQPPKLKAQPRTASAASPTPRSPPTLKPAVPKAQVSFSPTGSRIPKWNPPGQIGKSPSSSQSPATRSPGQGLRLGLSRRIRVKPLHPSSATN